MIIEIDFRSVGEVGPARSIVVSRLETAGAVVPHRVDHNRAVAHYSHLRTVVIVTDITTGVPAPDLDDLPSCGKVGSIQACRLHFAVIAAVLTVVLAPQAVYIITLGVHHQIVGPNLVTRRNCENGIFVRPVPSEIVRPRPENVGAVRVKTVNDSIGVDSEMSHVDSVIRIDQHRVGRRFINLRTFIAYVCSAVEINRKRSVREIEKLATIDLGLICIWFGTLNGDKKLRCAGMSQVEVGQREFKDR